MGKLSLTLACGAYDRTEALWNGVVQPEGIDLTYLAIQSPPEIFARMVKHHAFDLAEMSSSLYFTLRPQGEFPFIALPIFPSKMFRHGFIFVNTQANIKTPKDLEGKKVGVPEYRQTAAVWIRGILQQEYGVSLNKIHWFEGGMNAPRRPDVLDLKPEGQVSLDFIPEGKTLNDMLENGELDAAMGARKPACLGTSSHVQRLFPNYREVERNYYRKTGIFPIMHILVMKENLYREKPWVAESIYKAFVQARDWCLAQIQFSGTSRYMLPWLFDDVEEMLALFGPDPWSYGLEANRTTLETLVNYLVDQRFLPQAGSLDEMFTPVVTVNE
ncbi:MAG: ABC transporter substrate-binding protein [Acidobacteriota bacterium]